MDALLTEEQQALVRMVRAYVNREVMPLVEEYEEKGEFPLHLMPKMGELGLLGAAFPEVYGGTGAGLVAQMLVVEELSRASGGISATVLVQCLAINPVLVVGTEEQKQKYAVPAIKGEKVGAIAVTEPNHGSNVAGIEAVAERCPGGYVLNGTKMFITNGPFADFVLVAAKTDRAAGRKGITMFIVEKGQRGFYSARKLKKMGWHTSETAELVLEDCFVPEENRLGEEGRGFYYIMEDFNVERLFLAAQGIGLAQAALEEALSYARTRTQFGRPIIEFQAVSHKLADMATKVAAARHLAYNAARMVESGIPAVKEVSMAKYYASEMANRVTYDAIQVFGGYGYMTEYPVQRYYRDARILSIGGGTSEIQKEIIARRLYREG